MGLNKKISDILQLGQPKTKKNKDKRDAAASETVKLLTPKALDQRIKELESKMYAHAQNLEFEEAANTRDELHALRAQFIALS